MTDDASWYRNLKVNVTLRAMTPSTTARRNTPATKAEGHQHQHRRGLLQHLQARHEGRLIKGKRLMYRRAEAASCA